MLRRLLRYAKSILLLSRTRAQAAANQAHIAAIHATIGELFEFAHRISETQRRLELRAAEFEASTGNALAGHSAALASQATGCADRWRSVDQKIAATSAAFDILVKANSSDRADAPSVATKPTGTSLLLDNFYVALEAKFRGSTGDITQRQTIYLPDIEQAIDRAERKSVLDLGCGRGEWLALLRKLNIEGVGVDTNEGQLAEARENGLAVVNGDALEYLRSQQEASYAAITAFHIFEHLPFPVLAEWLVEIRRVLCPGGVLIAETPNPENLIVGANTFHLDPTHTKPLPSGVLSILAETVGLNVRQIRPLHPHGDLAEAIKDLPERTAYLLYGYQDYGLIAERPQREAT